MIRLLMMLIPHYITDRVALYYSEDETLQVLCLESEVSEDEKNLVTCYGTIKTLTWFNYCSGGIVKIDD